MVWCPPNLLNQNFRILEFTKFCSFFNPVNSDSMFSGLDIVSAAAMVMDQTVGLPTINGCFIASILFVGNDQFISTLSSHPASEPEFTLPSFEYTHFRIREPDDN